ncbi:MAG: sulfite dehydrogenase [Acidobacteria bacterium]|nr:sulfite dehydrogenase [Acidobacteriota bacterium]
MRERKKRQDGLTRRALLKGTVGAAAVTLHGGAPSPQASAAQDARAQSPPGAPSRQGRPPNELGTRSPAEQPKRLPSPTSSRTPLQDLHGTITPSDLHFERHHGGVAVIDRQSYRLLVHGMVDRPMTFTLDDLKRFPAASRICFLECSGNFVRTNGEKTTPQALCGLTSQSEWTGVRLTTILREVGARPQASWFLAEGQDAAQMTRSIPLKDVLEEAMIAYAQNGEALRPEQGYPARLLLPGFEGNSNVKWLRRLELADQPFMTREETSRYTEPLAEGSARQFSLVMDARSIITWPSYPQTVRPGWLEIRGLAWSGRGRIQRVEISTDRGGTWKAAELQGPVLPKAHTRFRLLWRWDGMPTEILSRAIDETGYVQPEWPALQAVRGRRTRYHLNPITGWMVGADGRVLFGIGRVSA